MKTPRWLTSPRAGGYTLVELLVVILIIVLVSAVALPTILPALSQRQINESARILQAALVGIRDAAIRNNAPRGLRFLLDPVLTQPPLTNATSTGNVTPGSQLTNAGTITLAYNRFIPIEPAGDYTEGKVTLAGTLNGNLAGLNSTALPLGHVIPAPFNIPYPWPSASGTPVYPCSPTATNQVLMVEESVYINDDPLQGYNPPTSWFWNIRIGDKIRFSDSGRTFTVVGPMNITPAGGNTEMFVNVGQPGTASPLTRTYYPAAPTPIVANPEFLFLVNGQDDNGDGIVDNGFNGIDDNLAAEVAAMQTVPLIDEVAEWETEQWVGVPSVFMDQTYTIARRPVPTQGAREIPLPPGIVIDATTWDTTQERSRLPIDPNTLYVDIMMNPSGEVIPTTVYSTPAAFGLTAAFYHIWLTERTDVHEKTELFGAAGNPKSTSATNPQIFTLPMPQGTPNYAPTNSTLVLKDQRSMVTVFTRNGLITTDTIENFNGNDINAPFYDARNGMREAK